MIMKKICCVDGCDTPNNKVSLFEDKFYCDKHRKQMKRNGKITHITAFKKPSPTEEINKFFAHQIQMLVNNTLQN